MPGESKEIGNKRADAEPPKEAGVVKFEDLDLSKLEWIQVGKRDSFGKIEYCKILVKIDGENFCLMGMRIIIGAGDGVSSVNNNFYVLDEQEFEKKYFDLPTADKVLLNSNLELEDRHLNWWKARTEIEKRSNRLGANKGREFYEKMLDLLQSEANLGQVIIHSVIKATDRGLEYTQWDRLFEPILTKRGYKKIGKWCWQKEYNSQK